MYNNKIVNALCEETIYPHLKDQGYPPNIVNATFVRSNVQKYSGLYSFVLTKTTISGGGSATARFHPGVSSTKLYGIIPGKTYNLKLKSFVPTGTTPGLVWISIAAYYDAAWHYTYDYASLNNIWEQLEIKTLIPLNTTGCFFEIKFDTSVDLGDQAYFDEIKVQDYERLIGYWPMDEPNGVTAFDMSGEGNDGTLTNSPTYVDGIVKKAVQFDAFNERIEIPGTGILESITDDGNSHSFSCWYCHKGLPLGTGSGYIFGRKGIHSGAYVTGAGDLKAIVKYFDNTSLIISSNILLIIDSWYYIVLTINEITNKFKIYINSILKDEADITKALKDYGVVNYFIGGGSDQYSVNGIVDECRIYSHALTQEEINFLYNHPDGLHNGLLGYWPFNDKSGIYAFDGSGQLNDGTLEGTAPVWAIGKSAGAINVPGTDERVDCKNNFPLNMIGYGDFSVAFWMKSKDTIPLVYGILFGKYLDDEDSIYVASFGIINQLRFRIEKNNIVVINNFNATPFNTLWNHIVIVINRTTNLALCYWNSVKDAIEVNISTLPFNCSNIGNVAWGAIHDGIFPYEGLIDEPRIYNRVLTEDEIRFLYEHPGGLQTQTGVQLKIYSISGDLIGFISDTDLSGSLLKVEVTEREIGGVEKFSFEIPKDYDIPISGGSECYFYISGILWFIGYIVDLPEKDQTDLVLKIKGNGFSKKLKEQIVNITYMSQTLAYIINDIGTNYLGTATGVYYDVAKIDVPIINNITIEFIDKDLASIFTDLLKIANHDYDTSKYRWYVNNERELVFEELSITLQDNFFEGYDYQSPKVDKKGSETINKILAFRTKAADRYSTEYVATYQDTESQGRLGIFEKKMIFPDYADNTTIQNIANSIIKQYSFPGKRIRIKDLVIQEPLSFGLYGLSNKRDYYWQVLAECDTLTGWDTGNLTVTTFSVSTDKVLTGLRSLKFITASGSLGDYVEFTLDEILYFPVNLRFYIYFVTTAISIKLVFIDKDDAQVEIEAKQIVDEWAKIEASIEEVTDLGFMKVSDGFLKVSDGFMKVRHLSLAGITSIKKIRIYINSNTITTFYVDRIEASSNMYKYAELLLKQSNYILSSLGFFVDAVFGEEADSIITEIDQRSVNGEIALDIYAKQ